VSRNASPPTSDKNVLNMPTAPSIPIDLLFQLEPNSDDVHQPEDNNCTNVYQQQETGTKDFLIPIEVEPVSFVPFHLPSIDTMYHLDSTTSHDVGRQYFQWEDNNNSETINNQSFDSDLHHLCDQDLLMIQGDCQQTSQTSQYQQFSENNNYEDARDEDFAIFQNTNGGGNYYQHHDDAEESVTSGELLLAQSAYLQQSLSAVADEEEVNDFADQITLGAFIRQQQSSNTNDLRVANNNNQPIPLHQQEHLYEPHFDTATVNVDFHPLETVVDSSPSFNDDRYKQRVDTQFPLVQAQVNSIKI